MKFHRAFLFGGLYVALVLSSDASATPAVSLQVGTHRIVVEVAATADSRAQGLAGRTRLEPDSGMLFVFDGDEQRCVWMKNTDLPLAAAFVTTSGRITELRELTPRSTSFECSSEPVRYVLELPSGWFNEKSVLPGAIVEGLEAL